MNWMETLLQRLLQRAATHARAESARAAELLHELTGKRLALAILGTPYEHRPLVIECTGQTLGLMSAAPPAGAPLPDATLYGAPLSLLALTCGDAQGPIQRGDVRIEGDAALAQRFEELGRLLAPDMEHTLSQLMGRSAAHVLMGGLRAAAGAVQEAVRTSVQNVGEYLAHESGDLVSHQEATHLVHGVEQAREQLDRLEARVSLLERQADSLAGGPEPS